MTSADNIANLNFVATFSHSIKHSGYGTFVHNVVINLHFLCVCTVNDMRGCCLSQVVHSACLSKSNDGTHRQLVSARMSHKHDLLNDVRLPVQLLHQDVVPSQLTIRYQQQDFSGMAIVRTQLGRMPKLYHMTTRRMRGGLGVTRKC